jgi:hypothetical protein
MTLNEATLADRRILVVEDNYTVAAGIGRALKAQGAEIIARRGR